MGQARGRDIHRALRRSWKSIRSSIVGGVSAASFSRSIVWSAGSRESRSSCGRATTMTSGGFFSRSDRTCSTTARAASTFRSLGTEIVRMEESWSDGIWRSREESKSNSEWKAHCELNPGNRGKRLGCRLSLAGISERHRSSQSRRPSSETAHTDHAHANLFRGMLAVEVEWTVI